VPILPMVLVNGTTGIGTGFSTHVPSFSPRQLAEHIRSTLQANNRSTHRWLPYYEGFQGTVEEVAGSDGHKFLIKGRYEVTGKPDQIRITELPVGTWTLPYKAWLEQLCDPQQVDKDGKKVPVIIKDVVSHCTDTAVDFTVDLLPGKLAEWMATKDPTSGVDGVEKTLKLTTTVATTNMHLFDEKRRLRKYHTVDEILDAYLPVRLALYEKRKQALLQQGEQVLRKLENKARYIQDVLDDVVDLRKKTNQQVIDMLQGRGFDMLSTDAAASIPSFQYLTKMPMDAVSVENREALLHDLQKKQDELTVLRGKTLEQLWLEELDAWEAVYLGTKKTKDHDKKLIGTANGMKPNKKK